MENILQVQIQAGIERVLAKRGWKLATPRPKFDQAVYSELAEKFPNTAIPLTEKAIERAVVHQYCQVLHAACRANGTGDQRRAFEELWNYLYRMAVFKMHDPELARDRTQQALSKIWENLGQCRDPGAFLYWCTLFLTSAMNEYFRKRYRPPKETGGEWTRIELPESVLEEPRAEAEMSASRGLEEIEDPDLGGAVEHDQLHAELVIAIRDCLNSKTQQQVIIELFFEERSVKQVADELGVKPSYVILLKFRALNRLRDCEAFIRFYEEWINGPPSANL